MPIDPDNLPSDVDALRAMLSAQAVETAEQTAMLAVQRTELAAARAGLLEQRYEIEVLQARLAKALRVAFGRSSEKLNDQLEQLKLTLANLDETIATTEPKDVEAEPEGTAPSKPARRPIPATLPRDMVEHAAPCNGAGACLECGGILRQLGEDVTELLDYIPSSFRVIRHVRPKLSYRSCETITGSGAQPADPPRACLVATLVEHSIELGTPSLGSRHAGLVEGDLDAAGDEATLLRLWTLLGQADADLDDRLGGCSATERGYGGQGGARDYTTSGRALGRCR